MSPRGQPSGMSFGVPPFTKGVKLLMIATLVVSVLTAISKSLLPLIALSPDSVLHGMPIASAANPDGMTRGIRPVWTLLTYTFAMPDPISLIFGLMALWFVGAMLEQRWGFGRFLATYFAISGIAGLLTTLLGLISAPIAAEHYIGNWPAIEGLVAATAILMPTATFFLYFFPVQARWMLPISAGMTLLFMLMQSWVAYLPHLLGLAVGAALTAFSPGSAVLRARVWMIDRKMKRSKLRVVRSGDDDQDPFGGTGRGSDGFLH